MTTAQNALANTKSTLVDDAYEVLRLRIRSNQMPPGLQIPEPELAMQLGMSRTPVREALIKLEADGLVELIPRRGVRVLPVSTEDMQEIYAILTALEPFAARILADLKPDKKQIRPLVEAVEDMEAAIQSKDLERWAAADDRFHTELLSAAGNRRMCEFVSRLYDQAHRARMITLRLREIPKKSTGEQRQVLDAILQGDGTKAERIFRKHRQRTTAELVEVLNKLQIRQL